MWWTDGKLNLSACRGEYGRHHRRYCRAIREGDRDKIHQLENLLLKAHSGKVIALAQAASKKKIPLYPAKLDLMASLLTCWEQPDRRATLYFKEKSDGSLRPVFSYELWRVAQQYLVVWVLAPRLRLHEGQYGVPGKGPIDAVEAAKQLIRDGYHWVIRGDIKNCYPSMNGDKVLALLPGPRAVMRQVILPPPEEHLSFPYEYASLVAMVRRGLPQGAASTPVVAAALLAPVLSELASGVVPLCYVDDFAVFAKSKAAAADAMNTLQEALWAAPVGNLQLKFCEIRHVSQGFGFLGYHLVSDGGPYLIARPKTAAFEKLEQRLDVIDAQGFLKAKAEKEKMKQLISWRCTWAAWEGDELGDSVLVAIIAHHFSDGLEERVQRSHERAMQTREQRKEKMATPC